MSTNPLFEATVYAEHQRVILERAHEVVRILEAEFNRAETPTMWGQDVATSEAALVVALMQAHGWEQEGLAAIRLADRRIYG